MNSTPIHHTGSRIGLLCLLLLLCVANAKSQSGPSGVELAVTYTASASNLVSTNEFNLQGGSLELSGNIFADRSHNGFGIAANVSGLHTSNSGGGIPISLVTDTFGPRYTFSIPRRRPVSLFGEGLVGEAHGFRSTFPSKGAPATSASSLAVQVGGGLDIRLSQHLAIRAVQASWLRTQLPNASTNVQNNLTVSAGLILR